MQKFNHFRSFFSHVSVELFFFICVYIQVWFCVLFEDTKKSFFYVPAFAFALFHLSGSIDVYRRPPPPTHTPPATHTHSHIYTHCWSLFALGRGQTGCVPEISMWFDELFTGRENREHRNFVTAGWNEFFYALILVNSSTNYSDKKWDNYKLNICETRTSKQTYSVRLEDFIFNFSKLLKSFVSFGEISCNMCNDYIPACFQVAVIFLLLPEEASLPLF